jgi:uncharacterized membrane protein (DUF485 family)
LATDDVGTIDYKDLEPLEEKTARAMSEELNISLILSAVYFAFLLGVTILNYAAPGLMKTALWGGMTVTWFATAIGAMVMASLIAWLHVRHYQKRLSQNIQDRRLG